MISKPNTNTANDGDLAGVLGAFLKSRLMNIDDMLPAVVVSYDDASNRATLKPLVQMLDTAGNKIPRANIHNIPVFRFGGGGFFMRFPIKAGDFGWIKANDRDISLVFQRGGLEDIPNTERIKSFSDAMFFPDTLKGWLIDGGNLDAVVLQSMDGASVISVHQDKVEIKTENINLESKTVSIETETFELNAQSTTINSPDLTIESDPLQVGSGGSSFNSDLNTNGNITNKGKDIGAGHTHSGVQSGGDNSGVVT